MACKIGAANFVHTWLQNVRGCDHPEHMLENK